MLLFFLLTALPVTVLVPLTEGTWLYTSAIAHALVEPAGDESDNDEDQCRCYKIRHKKYPTLRDKVI
jgi:hypothetical protein